jgi:hypothetical protein
VLLSTFLFTALLPTAGLAQSPDSVEIPFEFREGLIWLEVSEAHGAKPLRFLLDTGAGVSVIDLRVAERLGLKRARPVQVTGVRTTATGFWPQRLALKLGDALLPRDLLAVDLSQLGRTCATPVDGLVGADFFRDQAVQIDFRRQVIRLLTREQRREVQGETVLLDVRSCGMRVPVRINGSGPEWLRLDTGCVASLHWVTTSVEPKLCRRQLAVGLTELALPTTTVTAELGSRRFDEARAVIHERCIFAGEAGLLGNGLLARFAQVTVDAKAGRMILSRDPNPAPTVPAP